MSRTIAKSFVGGFQIDLSELKCLNSASLSSFGFGGYNANNYQAKSEEGEITLTNGPGA